MESIAIICSDSLMRRQAVDEVISRLVPGEDRALNVTYLVGSTTDAYTITCFLRQAPFGGDHRIVVVQDVDGVATKELNKLASELESIPDTACLVLVTGTARKDCGLGAKLLAEVTKRGKVLRLGGASKQDKMHIAVSFATNYIAGTSARAQRSTVVQIVERVGGDLAALMQELCKLVDYVGNGEITPAVVDLMLIPPPETVIFGFVDAIIAGDPVRSVVLARRLTESSDEPGSEIYRVMTLIRRRLLLLWQAKLLLERGCDLSRTLEIPAELLPLVSDEPSIVDTLKKTAWLVGKFVPQARSATWEQLASDIECVTALPDKIKVNEYLPEPELLLQLVALWLCGYSGLKGMVSS